MICYLREYTRVYSGAGCVYSLGGVRQISQCVTAAIKVVALDTAHEQHNDCRLMLISPRLAYPKKKKKLRPFFFC